MQRCASFLRLSPPGARARVAGRQVAARRLNFKTHWSTNSTRSITAESPHDRLVASRRNRPVALAMNIYKWQYVPSVSALQRITGILLSGNLYGFAMLYLLTPLTDIFLDSSTLATSFGSLPFAMKTAVKFGLSMPLTYHGFNGIEHLIRDTGRLLGKKDSGRASWVVLG